jgi:putative transposase
VDTLGLVLEVVIHRADIQDRDGARFVLAGVKTKHPRLELVWTDQGYAGELETDIPAEEKIRLEVVSKQPDQKGFVVQPRRWVVERTFAWIGKCRRLSKDYEQTSDSAKAFIYTAMIKLMARRLTA